MTKKNTKYTDIIRSGSIRWKLVDAEKGLYEYAGLIKSFKEVQKAHEAYTDAGTIKSLNTDAFKCVENSEACESCSG